MILAIAGAITLVIVLGVAVHKLTAQPNWYQNGYKFNETYLAEYGVLPAADFFWCGNAVDQQSEGGVPTNSPGGNGYSGDSGRWVSGCEAGMYAGATG